MTATGELARRFAALHRPGRPLILYNVWDPGSARVVAGAGAQALATGSLSVAAANGYPDGEHMPLDMVLANGRRIVDAVDLPVSVDFERGYGDDAGQVGDSAARLIETGAIGCNIEDSIPGGALRDLAAQCTRLQAVRDAAAAAGTSFFLNARTDVFFTRPAEGHDRAMAEAALERAAAFADAGADGLFVPMLGDERLIALIAERSPLPVNVMARPGGPSVERLAELGVARISFGPGPYRRAMAELENGAAALYGAG